MRKLFLSLVALLSIGGAYSFANYTMTQGAGTTFGSAVVGGFHYVQMFICDVTTPAQCAAVSASGAVKVDGSAVTQPVSGTVAVTGVATAANQTTGNTSLGTIATNSGTQATAANQSTGNTSLATIATNSATQATSANQATANASLATIATNSSTPLPACTAAPCTTTVGNVGFDPSSRSPLSAAINVSTITTTQLVALSGSTLIYVTSFDVIAGGTGNITFVYGTGSSCGTGTTALTGAYPLVAQAGISKGSGVGTILKVPAGNALCVTTSAAVQMSGSVSYMQF